MLKTKDWSWLIKSYNPTINCPCSKLNTSWALPRGCLLKECDEWYEFRQRLFEKFDVPYQLDVFEEYK